MRPYRGIKWTFTLLQAADAHSLSAQFGFHRVEGEDLLMEL